ncbi:hypothetical protein PCASD_06389 [Puccinia coronata f. sp. avenae]|uniref:Uncharacterized protein n=1 Tax=Puccinia coronata f. sp. avenae TaxID=200324 RepID=A0A2N5UX68_9BASI|nr:hypothetical protein PCASD_06389 [Puccinia coronata f. sp. avenae]
MERYQKHVNGTGQHGSQGNLVIESDRRAIIKDTSSHSDDKYDEGSKGYIIKTLPFQSPAANDFFRVLDLVMLDAAQQVGGTSICTRVVPPTPQSTRFPEAPKRLLLDFYDPNWFNALETSDKDVVTNIKQVAFLPDVTESFSEEREELEKLCDQDFSDIYFNQLTVSYNLTNVGDPNNHYI